MILQNQDYPKHIYLADDDADDRAFFAEALSAVDNSVVLVESQDGQALMQKLYLPPMPMPDVVFLDLNMPKQNGFECLEEIRKDKGDLNQLNVVIFTTSSSQMNIDNAFELGASFYAVKPTSFHDLKLLLTNVLKMNWRNPHTTDIQRQFLLVG